MKNLHLMSMPSGFNTYLMEMINEHFPHEDNYFVWKKEEKFPAAFDNAVVDSRWFNVEYINTHHQDWDQIFLHELFLTDRQLLFLNDDAAKKITWVVWGHDLYRKPRKPSRNLRSLALFVHRWLRQYSFLYCGFRKRVAQKVGLFRGIATGYLYDEKMIRKRYGSSVPVVYGPYFSKDNGRSQADTYREMHLATEHSETRIMLGHCGSKFNQHEKYLRKLAKYRKENIHIYLVLSYLASSERISKIKILAESLFRKDQITVLTELMPRRDYYTILSTMDIGIFPFKQQSGLGNTKRLAYMGVKLYLNPKGVLAKGFKEGGVTTYDCKQIGRLPFPEFAKPSALPDKDAPLFDAFDYDRNVRAWKSLLYCKLN